MNIFLDAALAGDDLARLREITADDHLVIGAVAASGSMPADFAACEIAFGNVPAAWIAASDALRWVQLESVGFGEYGGLDGQSIGARLTLTNLSGFFAEPVAESILAGILALYRGIDRVVALRRTGDWQGDTLRPRLRTLAGARIVLFGYGSINQRLAEVLAPFHCPILSFARDWQPAALDAALAQADVVVSVVPHTPATDGVFDARRLALLPASAIFANFGRGSVVDDDALAEALTAGRLAGAVIDVTRDEPLDPGHRFWSCANLILTQHSAGGTGDERQRKFEVFAANLARYRAGGQLEGVVDFHRGY
jgi:glyoxylate/hydroxypyruvate reductase A